MRCSRRVSGPWPTKGSQALKATGRSCQDARTCHKRAEAVRASAAKGKGQAKEQARLVVVRRQLMIVRHDHQIIVLRQLIGRRRIAAPRHLLIVRRQDLGVLPYELVVLRRQRVAILLCRQLIALSLRRQMVTFPLRRRLVAVSRHPVRVRR